MRRTMSILSWIVLTLGSATAILAALTIDSPLSWPWGVGFGAGATLTLIGFALHRPPGFLTATTLATFFVLIGAQFAEQEPTSLQDIELLYLTSLIILNLGIFRFLRFGKSHRHSSVLPDGLIVALGAWIIIWVLIIQPSLEMQSSSSVTVLQSIVLGTAITAIFLLAIIVFSHNSSSLSLSLFGLAITAIFIGVVLRALSLNEANNIATNSHLVPFLFAVVFVTSAFMHPSIHTISRFQPVRKSTSLMFRLTTTATSLFVPILLIALTDPFDTTDRVIRALSIALLALVVILRVIQSVHDNSRAQNHLMRNALTDSLTGLPNRILMLEHISEALESSWLTNNRPTVLFIDVDRFKNINDSLGHSTGDVVLTHVASRLLLAVPKQATVARISGDEFVILDPTTQSPTQSVLLAEKVLDSLRSPLPTSSGDMFVTASIGVAYAPKHLDLTSEDLVQHADTAMYRAKDAGRNCIALFDDTMLELVSKRLDIETSLYRALQRNELQMVFQPIVDMQIGMVVGFEALMRWNRTDGAVPPTDFIPIAEETGIIVPLGTWALNDALVHLRGWINDLVVPVDTSMSVNVSARQLQDPEFVTHVRDALATSGIPPEQLSLEITESILITEDSHALVAMKNLAAMGVQIAVDDFGTGYSSLSVLHHFPLHAIKIDRAFVNNLSNAPDAESLVRTIIAMAATLGADVIAEGVETSEQMKILIGLNCAKAQGYFFQRPVAASDIPQAVAALQSRDSWLG